MSDPELVQTILGLLAVGGIGGIWFRLGTLSARSDGFERRLTRLEAMTFKTGE